MSLITPDFGLLVWMTLIFGIVFFILAKFGFPAITGMVDQRNAYISESLQKADEANKRLEQLAQEQSRMLEESRMEKAGILKEASDMKNEIIAQARKQAQEEASRVMEKAREDIAALKEEALDDARREIASISVKVAEQILHSQLDTDKSQDELIGRLIEKASWDSGIKN